MREDIKGAMANTTAVSEAVVVLMAAVSEERERGRIENTVAKGNDSAMYAQFAHTQYTIHIHTHKCHCKIVCKIYTSARAPRFFVHATILIYSRD